MEERVESIPGRRDWFRAGPWASKHLAQVPGVQLPPGTKDFVLHRTHLPLLPMDARPALAVGRRPAVAQLWRHQLDAAQYIRERRGTLLADEMRLGKTGAALASHNPLEGVVMVIGPLNARPVWAAWFERLFPTAVVAFMTTTTADFSRVERADCIYVHHDILKNWGSIGRFKIGTLILDEPHAWLTRASSKRGQIVIAYAGQAKRVIACTGTPMWNRPASMYAMLDLLNPGAWGSKYDFGIKYCDGGMGEYGFSFKGTSREDEFKSRMTEVMLRRTREEVFGVATPLVRSLELIDVDAKTSAKADGIIPLLQEYERSRDLTVLSEALRWLGETKLERALELIEELDEPVVVWTWHRALPRRFKFTDRLTYVLIGGMSDRERERVLREWNADSSGVLVISLAFGTAIDLSHAKHAFVVEMNWTPAVMSQAEARIVSSDHVGSITYLALNHPVEAKIVRTLMDKCEQANRTGIPAGDAPLEVLGEVLASDLQLDTLSLLFADWRDDAEAD